jgi:NACHT domain
MDKLAEVVLSGAMKKALELGFDNMTSVLKRLKSELSTPQFEIEKAISDHQDEIARWASTISFSDSPMNRRLLDFFVPLDICVGQARLRLDDEEIPEVKLEDALGSEVRSHIILGQPGAGKTTAIKHMCARFASEPDFLKSYELLIHFQLRDINLVPSTIAPEYIRRSLQDLLRLRISYPDDLAGEENIGARRSIRDQVLADWLNNVRALIILDGFDEITFKAKRDLVVEELRRMARQLTEAAFIMTTRSGEFNSHIEKVRFVEIKPFSHKQIATFAERWLGEADAINFLSQLRLSPFSDTAIRPLTLAHLCVIFEKSKRIPSKPKTIYKKIVRLLIEDWDQEKSVVRESAYADFEADRKEEFLAHLSYELTHRFKGTAFDECRLLKGYEEICGNFDLRPSEATKVVAELETHTGLILKSGHDRYEFSHKSLQEYLAAEFIVKLPSIPGNMIDLQLMPNELAVATAISSQPSEYLTELVIHHFNRIRTSFQFTRSFVNRLLLENPDFEKTPRVGYALLALYSQYLRAVLHSEELQQSLFVMDSLANEFTQLAQKIKDRVSLTELDELFDRVETTHTFEGDAVWRLQRKKQAHARLRRADLSSLPNELWVRGSLLDTPLETLSPPGSADALLLIEPDRAPEESI